MKDRLTCIFRRSARFLDHKTGASRKRFAANREKLRKNADRPFVDVMPGIEMPMVIDKNMYFAKAYSESVFEPECLCFFKDRIRPGQTILDVGANVGYFSLFFAKLVGPKGRVFSFEPNEYVFGLLERNKALNALPWLRVERAGLGEADGTMDFHCGAPGMDVYSSLGEISHPNADKSEFTTQTVQVVNGGRWLRKNGVDRVDLMKIDVEGGELSALKGLEAMLEKNKVAMIVMEVSETMSAAFGYTPLDLFGYLTRFGYSLARLEAFGQSRPVDGTRFPGQGMYIAKSRGR